MKATSAARMLRKSPELQNGDRMTRAEFHRIYEQMPEDFRAELIGGIVHVSSPLSVDHATNHVPLSFLLFFYEGHTPGVQVCDNATVFLGEDGEPQPDLFLRILPEFGGQSKNSGKYVSGAPELIAEIAGSSRAIDLHQKREEYARHGVLEYLVVCVAECRLRWFDLSKDVELSVEDDMVRLRTFPGLWIHVPALFARDVRQLLATLQKGLASPEHVEFVRRLEGQRSKTKKPRKRKNR